MVQEEARTGTTAVSGPAGSSTTAAACLEKVLFVLFLCGYVVKTLTRKVYILFHLRMNEASLVPMLVFVSFFNRSYLFIFARQLCVCYLSFSRPSDYDEE